MAGAGDVGCTSTEQRACRRDIEHLIADCDAEAKRRVWRRFGAKQAIRQILDREIAIRCIGALDKTAAGWIMGLVEGLCHVMVLPAFCYESDMDSESLSHWAIVPREAGAWKVVP